MKQEKIEEVPVYPEPRRHKRPTTEYILRLFSWVERHVRLQGGRLIQIFEAELTDLQCQILALLGVPERAFRNAVAVR